MSTKATAKVLFLTTYKPELERYWNAPLPSRLGGLSNAIDVSIRSWHTSLLDPSELAETYSHICLVTVGHYHEFMPAFKTLLEETIPEVQKLNPALQVWNSPSLIEWNRNKTYLSELELAGFTLPQTLILPLDQSLDDLQCALQLPRWTSGEPIIAKSSIGVGGRSVARIADPHNRSKDEDQRLQDLIHQTSENGASIILQEYIPEVAVAGEWSLIFICGKFVGCWLKTAAQKEGDPEFRINPAFGGTSTIVENSQVPRIALESGERAWEWLERRFGTGSCTYARVDGIVRESGAFALMELECIEPTMFLDDPEMCSKITDSFSSAILKQS